MTGKKRGRRPGGNHGYYICPGTKREHTHVVWESKKDPCSTEYKAFRKPEGIWIAGAVCGEKTPGFVERNAADCTQTFIKLGLLLVGSQHLPEGKREATPF